MWIDTHCHLGDPAFDADRTQVVERMRAAGVSRALVIESDLSRLDATLAWIAGNPVLGLATGCHPHDARAWSPSLAERLGALWRGGAVSGAGEMGLDYHYDHSPRDVQRRAFSEQLALAVACDRPVIVHAREADADVAAVLREQPTARVVLHSFSSGPVLRDAGLNSGWYFSFSGMLTFRNWNDRDTVTAVASERMLIETDAPYLSPVPHRGHRNEPAHVALVARGLAAVLALDASEVASLTTGNAARLFGWKHDDTNRDLL